MIPFYCLSVFLSHCLSVIVPFYLTSSQLILSSSQFILAHRNSPGSFLGPFYCLFVFISFCLSTQLYCSFYCCYICINIFHWYLVMHTACIRDCIKHKEHRRRHRCGDSTLTLGCCALSTCCHYPHFRYIISDIYFFILLSNIYFFIFLSNICDHHT